MAGKHVSAMFVVALAFIATSVLAMYTPYPPNPQPPSTLVADPDLFDNILLRLQGSSIVSLDTLSLSDPKVILYQRKPAAAPLWTKETYDRDNVRGRPLNFEQDWQALGETETVPNTRNPQFQHVFNMEYHFEQMQNLRFEIWDVDKTKEPDFIGYCETTLAKIASAKDRKITMTIQHPVKHKRGFLTAQADKNHAKDYFAEFKFSPENLRLPSIRNPFSKPEIYFTIWRQGSSVYKSGTSPYRDKSAQWGLEKVPLSQLFNENMDEVLQVRFWIEKKQFGVAYVKQRDLRSGWTVPIESTSSKKPYGTLKVEHWNVFRMPTFVDFLPQMKFATSVAIDWTASNGNPSRENSLHYRNPVFGEFNPYQKSILTVVSVLEEYDSDKRIPAFGFGGYFPSKGISHLFPLHQINPELLGAAGILDAYSNALFKGEATLSGPTNFSPAIIKAMNAAKEANDNEYHILMIITDGDNTDTQETIDAIVEASSYPLSVIIIGVGNGDFDKMKLLDDGQSGGVLTNKYGKPAARDIVQFVAMSEVDGMHPNELNKKVLEEIPEQLISHMRRKNILPRIDTDDITPMKWDTVLGAASPGVSGVIPGSHTPNGYPATSSTPAGYAHPPLPQYPSSTPGSSSEPPYSYSGHSSYSVHNAPPSGYASTGYSSTGYPSAVYPSTGYSSTGYPSAGYPSAGYSSTGYAQPSYAQPSYAQPSYAQPGYAGYAPPADAPGAHRTGHNTRPYPPHSSS